MSPKHLWMWGACGAWLLLDQGSKILTRHFFTERGQELMLIPGWFGFTHATNKGAAFSAMSDSPYRLHIFLSFTAVALVVTLFASRFLQGSDRWPAAAIGTLLAGTLGNGIDRALFGQVTDMIKVAAGSGPLRDWAITNYGTTVWPIFNIADTAIWVGVIGFPLAWLFVRDGAPAEASPRPTGPNASVDSAPSLD